MRALYVTHFLPDPTAPARRIQAIATLLESCGYEVEVALAGVFPSGAEPPDWMGRRVFADGALFLPDRRKLLKNLERLTSRRASALCEATIRSSKPDLVLVYGVSFEVMTRLMGLRDELGFSLVVDDTDWFDLSFKGDVAGYVMERSKSRRFDLLDPRADGVIAISPYLRDHFESLGTRTFFLPSIVPHLSRMGEEEFLRDPSDPIRFVYAGSLGAGKDLIEPVLDAFEVLPAEYLGKLSLEVIGPSAEEVAEACGHGYSSPGNVAIVGRRPHEYVESALSRASFSFLLRKPERYAKAGFSTKFGECMCMGVPMICNEVGGADTVLESGVDGLVLPDAEAGTVLSALVSIAEADPSDLLCMRRAARRKAETLFDPKSYAAPFARFLEEVRRLG